ncbi:MAG TPA: P-loop NTPase [Bdellovibrionota bacterium]|nr:P-loop NTPase [Bdellovibrionota bacterium]
MFPALAQVKHIIAVASGKGGVGKSTVSTNLAIALRASGATVGLLDADIYGPSQTGMLGAKSEDRPMADGEMIRPLNRHGVKFISMGSLIPNDGPVVWRAPMATKMIQQFLGGVQWGALDYLLIDLPPGTGDVQLTLAQQASISGAVIVTTPQDVALGIARKGLRMFEQLNVPILGIVENMSGFTCGHCGKETAVFKKQGGQSMASTVGVPFLGSIPLDPEIMASGDEGVPVLEKSADSPAARAFLAVANRVIQGLSPLESDEASAFEPQSIDLPSPGELVIRWPDGHQGRHLARSLRLACGCAHCVDENTGKRVLDPARVPLDVGMRSFSPVGRYALSLVFTDGHDTGIYPYKKLRHICECGDCTRARGTNEKTFSV